MEGCETPAKEATLNQKTVKYYILKQICKFCKLCCKKKN